MVVGEATSRCWSWVEFVAVVISDVDGNPNPPPTTRQILRHRLRRRRGAFQNLNHLPHARPAARIRMRAEKPELEDNLEIILVDAIAADQFGIPRRRDLAGFPVFEDELDEPRRLLVAAAGAADEQECAEGVHVGGRGRLAGLAQLRRQARPCPWASGYLGTMANTNVVENDTALPLEAFRRRTGDQWNPCPNTSFVSFVSCIRPEDVTIAAPLVATPPPPENPVNTNSSAPPPRPRATMTRRSRSVIGEAAAMASQETRAELRRD
uniref:Uncharacterized protein n=1 Tax=Leersia perrieri TaxID=77586 RepID=A0A0D9W1A3_9ORYZ